MRGGVFAGLALVSVVCAGEAMAADATRTVFGETPAGETVEVVTLTNGKGMTVRVITLGAALQAALAPDRQGRIADVQLGHDTLDAYLAKREFFGATVGRVANRIANGRFVFDGKTYETPINNGPNSLHGGTRGFDQANWEVVEVKSGPVASVTFRYVSPDGDMGYPGELTTTATWSLNENNELSVDYRARTDRPTLVNLSHHGYWNLAGEGAPEGAMGHLLTIPADEFTPTDATAIPTGEFRKVEGTPFDFRRPTPVGLRVRDYSDEQMAFGRGYDHNWVISREKAKAPRLVARLEDPGSGRVMEVFSDQPGLQFYSGNFHDGTTVGKSGRAYRMGDSIVLEPQMFPDTPNRPEFGSIRLDPNREYRNLITYRFSVAR
jgi:aldose 1-epimerase